MRLDENGKIPGDFIPKIFHDVVEGYLYNAKFYEDAQHTKEIVATKAVIYVDLTSDKTYRWTGSAYVLVGDGSKLYQHNIMFRLDVENASNLNYWMSIINTNSDSINNQTKLIAALYAIKETDLVVGAVTNSGSGTYANPIGTFTIHCGSGGENLHVYTPCHQDSTVTISDVEYTFSKIVVNEENNATLDLVNDSVITL